MTSGYLNWRNVLDTKGQLNIEPMDAQELWEWLWYSFNRSKAPILNQFIRIRETEDGIRQKIPPSGQKDLVTLSCRAIAGAAPPRNTSDSTAMCTSMVGRQGGRH
jgi:hypothetical protein